MDETMDRYLAYRNLLACEDHLQELLMGPESSDEGKFLRGTLYEVRYLRDDVIPKEKNKRYHCLVKHLSAAYEAAQEVAKATQEDLDEARAKALRSLLYSVIEKCLDRKVVICERCGAKENDGRLQTEGSRDSAETIDDGFARDGVQGISVDRITGLPSSEGGSYTGSEAYGAERGIETEETGAPF